VLLLALLFMPFADSALAVSANATHPIGPPQEGTGTEVSTGADPGQSGDTELIQSLSGSYVAFDPSAGGAAMYVPGTSQTFCFRSETYTNDYAYVYNNWLKFPASWNVSNAYVVGTPSCDSGAGWGTFGWSYQTNPYEINITHARYQTTTDHCVATYCVDVTSALAGDPAPVSWYFDGDGYGSAPHNPCSADGYTPTGQNACDESVAPTADVPTSASGLYFDPQRIDTSGCHGEQQMHEVKLYNMTGAEATVYLNYSAIWGVVFTGPSTLTIPDGAYASFSVMIDPHVCKDDGEIVLTVDASDGYETASLEIHKQIYSEREEWVQLATNTTVGMDNVLGAHAGKVWQITGYGTTGVSNYDPGTDSWTAVASSAPPFGQNYARSGCQYGNEVFMYGDAATAGFTGLWSYNMDTNVWTAETPTGEPPPLTGIWAPAWVADPVNHFCYLTGGANTPGAGTLTTVFVYDPMANAWLPPLPSFTTPRNFHAAFLFERPADNHRMLCVAGGNYTNAGLTSTQCYDFNTGTWGAENATVPPLPTDHWAMGYGQVSCGQPQLWMVGGVLGGGISNLSYFYDSGTGIWTLGGNFPPSAVYRTSAVVLDGTIYKLGGAVGGFSHTGTASRIEVCDVFDLIFDDDYGRSKLCINSNTGDYVYHILTGTGVGEYTGTGVFKTYNYGYYFYNQDGNPWLVYVNHATNINRATGYLKWGAKRINSVLYDRLTTDNPEDCD